MSDTSAELDALPVGSGEVCWHEANGPVIDDDRYMPVTTVWRLLAEAEARGYERGKRDALTEAATWIERDPGRTSGAGIAEWLRFRAAETPGGAA